MRLIDADKLYNWIKTECNPYGNPTIDFETGCKVLNMINRMQTAFDREKVITEISREEEYYHERTKLRNSNIRTYSEGAERAFCFARNIIEKGEIE